MVIDRVQSEATIREIERQVTADFVLLYTKDTPLLLGLYTTVRMVRVASDTDAALVYGDRYEEHREERDGKSVRTRVAHPVIDYQPGSIRDDFDFGSLMLIRSSLLHQYAQEMPQMGYQYAGLYALRLFLSRKGSLFHLNEFLYTEEESDLRASGVEAVRLREPRQPRGADRDGIGSHGPSEGHWRPGGYEQLPEARLQRTGVCL